MPAPTCLPIATQRAAPTTGAGTRASRAASLVRNAAKVAITTLGTTAKAMRFIFQRLKVSGYETIKDIVTLKLPKEILSGVLVANQMLTIRKLERKEIKNYEERENRYRKIVKTPGSLL